MNPKDYTAAEWTELARQLDAKKLKSALRSAYRVEAGKAMKIARKALSQSGLQTQGNPSGLNKGVRPYIYSRGGGFMVTVKPPRGRKVEQYMHRNRYGKLKPVLMWAEDGTAKRFTKTKTKVWTRSRKAHYTGAMPAYHYMQRAEPDMYRSVEAGLLPQVERQVTRAAKKAGYRIH